MICNLILLAFAATSLPAPSFHAQEVIAAPEVTKDPSLETRLARVVEELEMARVSGNVAGMSLAIVMDDRVVLTHGFGHADIEAKTPVTPDTIFGVGSTTKAFTSTLIGMLSDEGAMTWDDPVVEHLPYFELDTNGAEADVTLRDLLTHRSGFTRMSLLAATPNVPRELILKTATNAEPWGTFRKDFHYNNVMFLAAGVAAGKAGHATWDELIETRILDPLGMERSGTTYEGAMAAENLAKGYMWDDAVDRYDPKPQANIDGIGPAGSIYSSAKEMAQWVRFLTNHGELDGKRLISKEALQATWEPQISVGDGVSYGMGWFLRDWDGQRVVEHGGNISGHAAEVAFLPDAGVGFVLLTNASATPLQTGSINLVFDALLGETSEPAGDSEMAAAENLDMFAGKYVANFATFQDSRFTVEVKDGKLAVDVPGQTLYTLKQPDEEGKRYFELTDQIAVSFQQEEHDVVGMTMFQGGLRFELPKEGVEIAPEIPLGELQRFLGEYLAEGGSPKGTVVIQNNRLAIHIPGEMTYELHVPDEEGKRVFRAIDKLAVKFDETDEGRVSALTLFANGREVPMERLAAADQEVLPTVAELMEIRNPAKRLAALDAAGTLRYEGRARFVHAGIEGSYELLVDGRERYSEKLSFDPFGTAISTVAGDRGWTEDPMIGINEAFGDELGVMQLGHVAAISADWRETFDEVRVLGTEELNGRTVVRLRASKAELPTSTLFVDPETGDLVATERVTPTEVVAIQVRTDMSDFREVNGIRIPHRVHVQNDWIGRLEIEVDKITAGVEVDPERFRMSEED